MQTLTRNLAVFLALVVAAIAAEKALAVENTAEVETVPKWEAELGVELAYRQGFNAALNKVAENLYNVCISGDNIELEVDGKVVEFACTRLDRL